MMTATIKDQILRDLIATKQPAVDIDAEMQCKTYDIEPYLYTLVINQFNDMELITLRSTKSDTTADIKMEAIDFVNKGGFVVAEEIVNASLERLQLEIESLQTTYPEKANTFLSMLASLATIHTAFQTGR